MSRFLVDGAGGACQVVNGVLKDSQGRTVKSASNREFGCPQNGAVEVVSELVLRVNGYQLKDSNNQNAKTNASGKLQSGDSSLASTAGGPVATNSNYWSPDGSLGATPPPAGKVVRGCVWEEMYWTVPPSHTNCDLHTSCVLRDLTQNEYDVARLDARSLCRSDPLITFSDGTELRIELEGLTEVEFAAYSLQLPVGLDVETIDMLGDTSGRQQVFTTHHSSEAIMLDVDIKADDMARRVLVLTYKGETTRVAVLPGVGKEIMVYVPTMALLTAV